MYTVLVLLCRLAEGLTAAVLDADHRTAAKGQNIRQQVAVFRVDRLPAAYAVRVTHKRQSRDLSALPVIAAATLLLGPCAEHMIAINCNTINIQ